MKATCDTPLRKPVANLLLPPAGLSGAIFAALQRDTRGCALSLEDRYNHFSASPLCAIGVRLSGDCFLVAPDTHPSRPWEGVPLSAISLSGTSDGPQTSWSSGDFNGLVIAFYPEAFSRLFNIAPQTIANETVDARSCLSAEMVRLLDGLSAGKDARQVFNVFCETILPVWQRVRPDSQVFGTGLADWGRAITLKAALTGPGKSLRQVERRLRKWSGHSRSRLMRYARNEDAFRLALHAARKGRLSGAEIAADAGYADQSHMGREIRHQTGFSPVDLMVRMEKQEAFWSYRLLSGLY